MPQDPPALKILQLPPASVPRRGTLTLVLTDPCVYRRDDRSALCIDDGQDLRLELILFDEATLKALVEDLLCVLGAADGP